MKRILGIILMVCLVFSLVSEAFAAPDWEIIEQPKCTTTKKSIVLSIKTKGTGIKYQWVFVNPEDPDDTVTGKNLPKKFKAIKVKNYTKSKITLTKVPEELHGWKVYCHLYGNGYQMDSEPTVVAVYGLEPPEEPESADEPDDSEEPDEPESADEPEDSDEPATGDEGGDEEAPATVGTEDGNEEDDAEPEDESKGEAEPETEPEDETAAEPETEAEPEPEKEPGGFSVTADGAYLFELDSDGNVNEEAEGVSTLSFADAGNFAFRSEEPFSSWFVNGLRFETENEITGFKVFNVTEDTAVALTEAGIRTVASSPDESEAFAEKEPAVDKNASYKVTCKGCSFTCMKAGIASAVEGEVPYGSLIYVFADNSEIAANGYRINGGEPESLGSASIQITVTGNTEIVVK